MAGKTANVLARVEPSIKEEAETILSQLGIPVSVVINMLYKQIIFTKSIPFSLTLPKAPVTREQMDATEFNNMIQKGLQEAKDNDSRPASDVFQELRQEI